VVARRYDAEREREDQRIQRDESRAPEERELDRLRRPRAVDDASSDRREILGVVRANEESSREPAEVRGRRRELRHAVPGEGRVRDPAGSGNADERVGLLAREDRERPVFEVRELDLGLPGPGNSGADGDEDVRVVRHGPGGRERRESEDRNE
jgi:hypothetical protein